MSTQAENTTGTQVATLDQFSIPDVLQSIKQKIASFQKIESTKFKTSGTLSGFPTNIQKEEKVDTLVKAFSSVLGRSKAYKEAATELGIQVENFEVDGGSVADWKHDIELRIKIVTQTDELAKLKALEKEASTFLSQEDQKAMFLQKLASSLGA